LDVVVYEGKDNNQAPWDASKIRARETEIERTDPTGWQGSKGTAATAILIALPGPADKAERRREILSIECCSQIREEGLQGRALELLLMSERLLGNEEGLTVAEEYRKTELRVGDPSLVEIACVPAAAVLDVR
jgi:hypothetical protein